MGRAEDLFARIETNGVRAIDALIDERASEELFLEFKRSADNGQGIRLHEHDRANLRKAIGGFANSEGGVVVWGIVCSKKGDVGDVATDKLPLTNPARFVSFLEGAVSGCTVPPVIGARSIAIDIGDSQGFVATYVPKSPIAPHQIAGEGRYLIRAGSDFVTAPHGVVAGLFGRAPHPNIYANFIVNKMTFPQEYIAASVTVVLVNDGPVVAEDLFLSAWAPGAPTTGQGVSIESLVKWDNTSSLSPGCALICPKDFRLPPGGFTPAVTIKLILPRTAIADFKCLISLGCRGSIPTKFELLVSKDQLDAICEDIIAARSNSNSTFDFDTASTLLLGLPRA